MEGLTFSKDFKIVRPQKPETELANEIYEWSGKQINYPRLMKTIKEQGLQAIRELYLETKKEGAGFKLFLWKLGRKENKTIWKN